MKSQTNSEWIDAAFHPREDGLFRVRFQDGTESYAVWMPELKGWAADLPQDWKRGDPVPDHGRIVSYRELQSLF